MTELSNHCTQDSKLKLSALLNQPPKSDALLSPLPQILPSTDSLNTPPPSPIKTKLPSIDSLLQTASMSGEESLSSFVYSTEHSPVTPPVFHSPTLSASYPKPTPILPLPQVTNPRKHRYRFTLADAPIALLDKLGLQDIVPHSINATKIAHVTELNTHKIKPRHQSRKNPYPMRAPNKTSNGITLKVDAFKPFFEHPRQLLKSNFENHHEYVNTLSPSSSSNEESAPTSPELGPKKLHARRSKVRRERGDNLTERRRKGNSLARVMADRGLLESSFTSFPTTMAVNGEIKAIRIPPPPPLEFSQLIQELNELNLDNGGLEAKPKITWKGGALSIQHLAQFEQLHPNEAYVASTLRLTPIQYLTAKHSLCSASRRYKHRSLPFRKSDAQKLLRIDVNKASKLWEFFHQLNWI